MNERDGEEGAGRVERERAEPGIRTRRGGESRRVEEYTLDAGDGDVVGMR